MIKTFLDEFLMMLKIIPMTTMIPMPLMTTPCSDDPHRVVLTPASDVLRRICCPGDGVVSKNVDTSRVQDGQNFLTFPRLRRLLLLLLVVGWISSLSGTSNTSLVIVSVTILTLDMSDSCLNFLQK